MITIQQFFGEGPNQTNHDRLINLITGGILAAITAHGPVTRRSAYSAGKRAALSLLGALKEARKDDFLKGLDAALESDRRQEDEEKTKLIASLKKQRDDLLRLCREAGLLDK